MHSNYFITLLYYIVKDSFILPLSLYYTPNVITISCIKVFRERFNIKFIDINDIISMNDYKINEEDIDQCVSLIQKLENVLNEKKLG